MVSSPGQSRCQEPEPSWQGGPGRIWTSLGRIQNSAPSFTPTSATLNYSTILFFPAAASGHLTYTSDLGTLHWLSPLQTWNAVRSLYGWFLPVFYKEFPF